MVLLVLNTMYWNDNGYTDPLVDQIAESQFEWLEKQLELAKDDGKKVLIMSHIPPGWVRFFVSDLFNTLRDMKTCEKGRDGGNFSKPAMTDGAQINLQLCNFFMCVCVKKETQISCNCMKASLGDPVSREPTFVPTFFPFLVFPIVFQIYSFALP